jgi:peptidoglycan/xylan/chitin deacetylase (PgdA/CDA1 family)
MKRILFAIFVLALFALIIYSGHDFQERSIEREREKAREQVNTTRPSLGWTAPARAANAPLPMPASLPLRSAEPAQPSPITAVAASDPGPQTDTTIDAGLPLPASRADAVVTQPDGRSPAALVTSDVAERTPWSSRSLTKSTSNKKPDEAPEESSGQVVLRPSLSPDEPGAKKAIPLTANVLGYHQFSRAGGVPSANPYNMSEATFTAEMQWLHENGYRVIPLSDLIRYLKGEIGLPNRSVVITIDDGYRSALTVAAPILKKYGYPWTFFIYPDFVGASANAVTWQNLLELQTDGVDIESHTKSHPFLTRRDGRDDEAYDAWLNDELAGSKETLEKKLGKKVIALAYPYGNYNAQVEAKALQAGYEAIFTVSSNAVHLNTPLKSIGRYIITKPVEGLFHNYLKQTSLSISDIKPAPGEIDPESRPKISVVLGYAGTIDPKSVIAEIDGMGKVPADFDPATQVVRIYLQRDLTQRVIHIKVHARDQQSQEPCSASWYFYYDKGTGTAQ